MRQGTVLPLTQWHLQLGPREFLTLLSEGVLNMQFTLTGNNYIVSPLCDNFHVTILSQFAQPEFLQSSWFMSLKAAGKNSRREQRRCDRRYTIIYLAINHWSSIRLTTNKDLAKIQWTGKKLFQIIGRGRQESEMLCSSAQKQIIWCFWCRQQVGQGCRSPVLESYCLKLLDASVLRQT